MESQDEQGHLVPGSPLENEENKVQRDGLLDPEQSPKWSPGRLIPSTPATFSSNNLNSCLMFPWRLAELQRKLRFKVTQLEGGKAWSQPLGQFLALLPQHTCYRNIPLWEHIFKPISYSLIGAWALLKSNLRQLEKQEESLTFWYESKNFS